LIDPDPHGSRSGSGRERAAAAEDDLERIEAADRVGDGLAHLGHVAVRDIAEELEG
jgi:hypothetical protein